MRRGGVELARLAKSVVTILGIGTRTVIMQRVASSPGATPYDFGAITDTVWINPTMTNNLPTAGQVRPRVRIQAWERNSDVNPEDERRLLGQLAAMLAPDPVNVSDLGRIVNELEAASSVLTHKASDWRRRFHEHWTCLEEVFALALDRAEVRLNADSSELVAESLVELRALLEEAAVDSSDSMDSPS